ncbi:4644_t:CDS:2 [Paraglomus occultum]|uniref:4644_t:CDS:1 n=1 Tax=Paraglomus occultum TaxID=144539 RepID=A0A9N9AX83_9GLOM|nr:4644_t:CDS:2 [Paraglomus occultum]
MSDQEYTIPLCGYAFVERSTHAIYVLLWFIFHAFMCDNLSALKPSRLFALDLKSIMTALIILLLLSSTVYNTFLTKIVYEEGFIVADKIRLKTPDEWSTEHQRWLAPLDYILMVNFGIQTCVFYLLQCFWDYTSQAISHEPIISSMEYRGYVVWSTTSAFAFAIIRLVLHNDEHLRDVIPLTVFSIQVLGAAILQIQIYYRFKKLIKVSNRSKNSTFIIAKARYFVDLIKILIASLLISSISMLVLCIDSLIKEPIMRQSDFAVEVLIAHYSFAQLISWIVLVLIVYPRKGFVGPGGNPEHLSSVQTDSFQDVGKFMSASATQGSGAGLPRQSLSISPDAYKARHSVSPDGSRQPQTPANVIPLSGNPLRRNISVSKDGRTVYAETKTLGKVNGSEFVAVEKADPSLLASYYLTNDDTGHADRIQGESMPVNGLSNANTTVAQQTKTVLSQPIQPFHKLQMQINAQQGQQHPTTVQGSKSSIVNNSSNSSTNPPEQPPPIIPPAQFFLRSLQFPSQTASPKRTSIQLTAARNSVQMSEYRRGSSDSTTPSTRTMTTTRTVTPDTPSERSPIRIFANTVTTTTVVNANDEEEDDGIGRRNLIRDIDNLENDFDTDTERYPTPGGEPDEYSSGEEIISEANSSDTETGGRSMRKINLESALAGTGLDVIRDKDSARDSVGQVSETESELYWHAM